MRIWSTVLSGAEWITGSQLRLLEGELVLRDDAARVKRGGPSKHIGRLVLTDRRLMHVPIRDGIVRRLRSGERELLTIPLTAISATQLGPASGLTRLMRLVILDTATGPVWIEIHRRRASAFLERLDAVRQSLSAGEAVEQP